MATESSRVAREEAAEVLCEVVRKYVIEHDAEIELLVVGLDSDVWDRAPGAHIYRNSKRERFDRHHIIYVHGPVD